MINCFGRIPATPFQRGDLDIVPALGGDMRLDDGEGGAVEHLILGDIVALQGTPWACCRRGFLAGAVGRVEIARHWMAHHPPDASRP